MSIVGNPFSPGNLPPGYTQGIAVRSKHRIKARSHVVVLVQGSYQTWCTNAPAMAENALGGPCPTCMKLLREYHAENGEAPTKCTCETEEHPEYGTCRKAAADCPVHEGN